jgi:hypothetical protein
LLLIIFVFDPLAITLVVVANQAFSRLNPVNVQSNIQEPITVEPPVIAPVIESIEEEITEDNTPIAPRIKEDIKQDIYNEKSKPVKKTTGRYY